MTRYFSWFSAASVCIFLLTLASCGSETPQNSNNRNPHSPDIANSQLDKQLVATPNVGTLTAGANATTLTNMGSMANSYPGGAGPTGKFSDMAKTPGNDTSFSKTHSASGELMSLDSGATGSYSGAIDTTGKFIDPGNAGNNVLNSKINTSARQLTGVGTAGNGSVSITTIRSGK